MHPDRRTARVGFELSDLQLELLAEEEPGVTRDEVEAEARRSGEGFGERSCKGGMPFRFSKSGRGC